MALDLSPDARLMLLSLLGMGAVHLMMFVWLYLTRIPAMRMMKINPQKSSKAVLDTLPTWAQNPANNYNNLAEAPTTFYGVVLTVVLLGQADAINAYLCLAYVCLRAVHSVFQASVNIIMIRFLIFSLSWLVLGALIVRAIVTALS